MKIEPLTGPVTCAKHAAYSDPVRKPRDRHRCGPLPNPSIRRGDSHFTSSRPRLLTRQRRSRLLQSLRCNARWLTARIIGGYGASLLASRRTQNPQCSSVVTASTCTTSLISLIGPRSRQYIGSIWDRGRFGARASVVSGNPGTRPGTSMRQGRTVRRARPTQGRRLVPTGRGRGSSQGTWRAQPPVVPTRGKRQPQSSRAPGQPR